MNNIFYYNRKHKLGFTIVELLIVIVVIAILAAVTIVAYNGIQKRSADSAASNFLAQAKKHLLIDKETNGDSFPSTLATANNGQGIPVPNDMTVRYTPYNNLNPQAFSIVADYKGYHYNVSNTSQPSETTGGTYKEELFSNSNLSGAPAVVNKVSNVNYSWGTGGPSGVPTDGFSGRWTTLVTVPSTGTYTFYVTSDDGQRLFVDGVTLVDDWILHGPMTRTASLNLTANSKVPIVYEFFESGGEATAILEWTPPGGSRAVLNAN